MTLTQILSKLKSLVYSKTETDTLLGNKAASSHTHSDYVPKDGDAVVTGGKLARIDNNGELDVCGGIPYDQSIVSAGWGSTNSYVELIYHGSERVYIQTIGRWK